MNNDKSILHVVNIYFVLPYFIGDQFKYLKSKGYDLHVICSPSEDLHNYSKNQEFTYKEINILRAFSIYQDLVSLIKIMSYIKKNKIKTVVGHTPKGALLAMIASKILRVPNRIYFRHGLMYETSTGFKRFILINIERLTALCAKKVVCVSPSTFNRSLIDKLNSKKKQIVIGKGTCGGIDALNKFNPTEINYNKQTRIKEKYNIKENCFVVGYCGRLVRDKGIIELVNSITNLQKKHNIQLLLVGDFEERDQLPTEIIDIIENNSGIIKTGFIYEDIEYFYSLMNLFILPSFREGFPTSVLEASSMGIPVLTTKATGCIDSIIEGVTGFFIENSADSISSEILKIINNKNSKEIGLNGREFILNNFDNRLLWPIIEKNLYEQV